MYGSIQRRIWSDRVLLRARTHGLSFEGGYGQTVSRCGHAHTASCLRADMVKPCLSLRAHGNGPVARMQLSAHVCQDILS
jgi:hypothetical protein